MAETMTPMAMNRRGCGSRSRGPGRALRKRMANRLNGIAATAMNTIPT